MARSDRGKCAYRHVDVSNIPDDVRAEILEDADAGGNAYGLRVVEVIHNGPALQNIYGVYSQDEATWLETKVEYGIEEDSDKALDLTAEAEAEAAEKARQQNNAEDAELASFGKGKK